MKKLILTAAIVGITALSAFAGDGGGCKGKGCTCSGSCKSDGCTMKCCSADDKKSCAKDSKCSKNGKCSKDAKSATDTKNTDTQGTQK